LRSFASWCAPALMRTGRL